MTKGGKPQAAECPIWDNMLEGKYLLIRYEHIHYHISWKMGMLMASRREAHSRRYVCSEKGEEGGGHLSLGLPRPPNLTNCTGKKLVKRERVCV